MGNWMVTIGASSSVTGGSASRRRCANFRQMETSTYRLRLTSDRTRSATAADQEQPEQHSREGRGGSRLQLPKMAGEERPRALEHAQSMCRNRGLARTGDKTLFMNATKRVCVCGTQIESRQWRQSMGISVD